MKYLSTVLLILWYLSKTEYSLAQLPIRAKATQPATNNLVSGFESSLPVPKLIPLAPSAAAIARYGDVQNNPNSGQISPSIPIYEIKLNDFSLPISLNYASNGLKMNDIPGWVGMGWSINAGGTISRQVRSIPDEVTYGYNGYTPTASVAAAVANNTYPNPGFQGLTQDEFLTKCSQSFYDLEPDMFFYSCGAYSGRFIFSPQQVTNDTKTASLIPLSDLNITAQFDKSNANLYNVINQQGVISSFKAVDPQGVIYDFTESDGFYEHNPDDGVSRSTCRYNTWYLRRITTPNGNIIEFVYTPRKISNPKTVSQRALIPLYLPAGAQSSNFLKSPQLDQAETIDMVLTRIEVNGGTDGVIQFTEQTSNRSDWSFADQFQNAKPRALDKITILNGKGQVLREFGFSYASTARLLLRSVTERNGTVSLPPHVFTYANEGQIPGYPNSGSTFSEDYWGFFNQCTVDCDKYVPAYTYQTQPTTAVLIHGTNKQPSATGSLTGQLIQIKYPTGGTSSFSYELNNYQTAATSNAVCSGPYTAIGTVTASMPDYDERRGGVITEQLINLPQGVALNGVCLQISYRLAIGGNPSDGVVGRVALYTQNNEAIFQPITLRADINDSKLDAQTILVRGNLTQQVRLVAELYPDRYDTQIASALANNQAEITVRMNQITPGTLVTRLAGGVRIKEITTCPNASSNAGCLLKTFTYTDSTGQSSGRLLTNLFYTTQAFKSFETVGGQPFTVPITLLASTCPISVVTSSGNHVYYEQIKIEEKNLDQTQSNGETRQQYLSVANSPDMVYYAQNDIGYIAFSPTISQDWRRGKPVVSQVRTATGVLLKDIRTSYVDKNPVFTNYNALKLGIAGYDKNDQPNSFIGFGYGLLSSYHHAEQTIDTDHFYDSNYTPGSLTKLIQTTTYRHLSSVHYFLTSVATQSSEGKAIETSFFYPNDLTSDAELSASATALLGVGKRSEKLKIVKLTNSQSTSTQKTFYTLFSGKVQPSKTTQLVGSSLTGSTIDFNAYDAKGNLLEFVSNNGYPTTYLWGYNASYPVAEIKNATYAQVVATGENLTQLGSVSTSESNLRSLIGALQQKLPNALIKGYTYDLGYGINWSTEPNGLSSYFVYDALGRLTTVKDNNQNTVKTYQYNYQQP